MVFNDRGVIILPVSQQHRDHKAEGISYEDNYKGNALAAMPTPDTIEIRYHNAFTDREVARILRLLLAAPELAPLRSARITYQSRPITLVSRSPQYQTKST